MYGVVDFWAIVELYERLFYGSQRLWLVLDLGNGCHKMINTFDQLFCIIDVPR